MKVEGRLFALTAVFFLAVSIIYWVLSHDPIGTTALASMISPFFVGMIADRFFPAQVVMGVMHLLGAGFMYYATTLMTVTASVSQIITLVVINQRSLRHEPMLLSIAGIVQH